MNKMLCLGISAMFSGIALSAAEPQKMELTGFDNQFESVTPKGEFKKWVFNDWSKSFNGGGTMTVSDKGRTGKCVALKTGDKQRVCFYSSISVPVVPGKDTIETSLFLKGKGSLMIMSYAYNENNKNIGLWSSKKITVDTPEWKEYQFRIPCTANIKGAKNIRIAPMVFDNSDLLMDDLKITLIRDIGK